jgi:CheY-like chemotaxis protein
LNGILGYAQILLRDGTIAPKQKKSLGIIQRCGNHLLTLINDILDLSKIEARKLELLPKSFHFPAFLRSIQELSQVRAVEKGLDIINDFDPNLPEGILADEKRLGQVLINLLGNAVKFTQTGQIYFRVKLLPTNAISRGTHRLRFEIEDSGVGISPEDMEKIFLPFEQVGDKRKKNEGTGLGLAISRQIISLMGGQLQATSQLNQGTTFWFEVEVPEIQNFAQVSSDEVEGPIIGYKDRVRKVLVVDDRWENRAVLLGLLEPLGFQVIEATNGREGLEKVRALKIDLLITDLVMPEMNGFDLLKHVRQSPDLEKMVAIASSASVFEADQLRSLNAGADDFLPKPVQTDKLLDLIKKHLQLEWVYGTSMDDSETESINKQNITPPPAEVLDSLSRLVEMGDIDAIIEQATMVQHNYPQAEEFALQIKKLAEACYIDELEQLINLSISTQE